VSYKTHSTEAAITAVFPKPVIPEAKESHWLTPRSGRIVALSPATRADCGYTRANVNISGPVDKYDASQIAEYFAALSLALHEQDGTTP
jgi:hypothetical protein